MATVDGAGLFRACNHLSPWGLQRTSEMAMDHVGSAIATLLWIIGSAGFSLYVSKFGSYDATYGSLAASVVLLLWFWLSALIILLGEEIDAELDQAKRACAQTAGWCAATMGTTAGRRKSDRKQKPHDAVEVSTLMFKKVFAIAAVALAFCGPALPSLALPAVQHQHSVR